MKVLHILKSLEKGGAERYVIDLCRELNKRSNIDYKLVIIQPGNDFGYITNEIPYVELNGPFIPSIRKNQEFDFSQYKQIVDEFQPDIIHTHLFRSELYSCLYVPKNVSYVTHGHDNMKEFLNLSIKTITSKSLLTNFFEKYLIVKNKYKKNNNCHFIANSNDTFSYYKKNVPPFLKNNVRLIEYGFDLDRFYNPNRITEIPKGKLKLINVGRFAIYKNQELLVKIAEILRQNNVDFEMNFLGVGVEIDKIKSLIEKANLQEYVILRGNVDNVEDWLNQSHIYLHSAYYEPFGLVLLEAMASGLPCIILNGKGNTDIIQPGENGYIFDEQNPNLFANKIVELTENSSLYRKLSKNAQKFASKFAIGPKTDELIDFYKSIIPKKK
jgi:glycosyltransferase involved in cell wall biosynthesis